MAACGLDSVRAHNSDQPNECAEMVHPTTVSSYRFVFERKSVNSLDNWWGRLKIISFLRFMGCPSDCSCVVSKLTLSNKKTEIQSLNDNHHPVRNETKQKKIRKFVDWAFPMQASTIPMNSYLYLTASIKNLISLFTQSAHMTAQYPLIQFVTLCDINSSSVAGAGQPPKRR